ncbi:hypothetical protein A2V71_03395 [Candidatus Berkelbacteria bacterium RBG_13_40_8]|uniref:Uncharacterized protein n=1 Tax=Candidatus Berkelbacteria bacterium RBG_13_40_8 TaxID=1797467 RepID=A0A1F5DQH2_9BACT|nr:MAG: hypothetical protein A2V71_03395 [Candidatus Berkelbacteria bacterium RBG_13_40_8]
MQNRCLGVFLIFLVVPLVFLSILEIVFLSDFTSSRFYKNLLTKNNSYSQSAELIQKGNIESGNFLADAAQNINASWLQENVEYNLDALFNFLGGKTATSQMSINLTNLKKNLTPIPDLSADAIAMIPDRLTFDSYKTFLEDLKGDLEKQSQGQQALIAQDIEDINSQIQTVDNLSAQFDNNLSSAKQAFFLAKVIAYVIFALTLMLLVIIAIICRRHPPAIFRWVGDALFIPALVLFLATLFSQQLITNYLSPLRIFKLTQETQSLVVPLYRTSINEIFSDIIKISFIVAFIGLSFIVLSYILPLFMKKKGA